MPTTTLLAFNKKEYENAFLFLATQVSEMMGRKFEEGDWAKVYCNAKGIPIARWSNLSIDIMYGNIGVEHKMICRRNDQSLIETCGTSIMHPAGTRAIRIPSEENPTKAARIVLEQYVEIIEQRTKIVHILNQYHHGKITRDQALAALRNLGMGDTSANSALPAKLCPIGSPNSPPDMRIGWLLWKEGLNEFLYFEEPMSKPNPEDFIAEWRDSGGGRRKKSRNLWVYNKDTEIKLYSITTEAGAKIQPYFTVPLPKDPNLYHFVVQGCDCGNGMVRVWLTQITVNLLKQSLKELKPETIAAAVESVDVKQLEVGCDSNTPFGPVAIEVLVPLATYAKLKSIFNGVSDEDNFRQLVKVLHSR